MSTENENTMTAVMEALAIFARGGAALAADHARAQAALDVDANLFPGGVGLREAKDRCDGTAYPGSSYAAVLGNVGAYPVDALGTPFRIEWIKAYRIAYALILAEMRLGALQDAEDAAWDAFVEARQARLEAQGVTDGPGYIPTLQRPA